MRRWLENPVAIVGILFALMVAFFALSPAQAQSTGEGLGGTLNVGLSYGTIVGFGTQDLRVTIMRVIQILFGFLGVVAIIIILWAGWQWMISGGDPQKIQEAKRTLVNAVLGLLIIFAAFAIVSFIISSLSGAVGPQGTTRRPPPQLPCFNCEALGGGIIEAVYPEPGARDVPRNTLMFVTFKVPIDQATIVSGGKINGAQVTIAAIDPPLGALASADVDAAATGDNLTFTFDPVPYLGDGVRDVRYEVQLGCGIKRLNGPDAFGGGCTGVGFAWSFTVGTRLDWTPPTLDLVFPSPDDTDDQYQVTSAQQSTGSLTVASRPRTFQAARVEGPPVSLPGPGASFATSDYNCAFSTTVCISYNGSAFQVDLKDVTRNPSDPGACAAGASLAERGGWLQPGVPNGPRSVILGCGIALNFSGDPAAGNQWRFRAFAAQSPDTLQIGQGPLYTFVDGSAPVRLTDILVGLLQDWGGAVWNTTAVAGKIKDALDAPVQTPDVAATAAGATVKLTAKVAGTAGNNIRITPSGGWATVSAFIGGADAGFAQDKRGQQLDVARNATPRLDFSETMFPLPISGSVGVVDPDGNNVGTLPAGVPPPYVTVQADISANDADGDGDAFDPDEYVGGTYLVSNVYRTVEFQSASLCGVCESSGVSCTRDLDCGGGAGSCKSIRNSCGDQIYCLPTVTPVAANPAGVTRFRMTVGAATLLACNESNGNTPADDCPDSSFPNCTGAPGICENTGGTNFPRARGNRVCAGTTTTCADDSACGGASGSCQQANDGAMDSAKNSLDGNRSGEADGRTPAADPRYSLNTRAGTPDSVEWTFWVNNRLELTPPKIKLAGDADLTRLTGGAAIREGGIFPKRNDSGMPITTEPGAAFTKVLSSSSLKPDNHYRNGRCGCGGAADCRADEECDAESDTCRSKSGRDNFCVENTECLNVARGCKNRWHVTLKDYACAAAGRCAGWWISNRGYDTDATPDGFPNFTEVLIEHTPLAEFSRYGVDMGSGIQDLYQNCYLPSEGPGNDAATGACLTTRAQPYCCDGAASATACSP